MATLTQTHTNTNVEEMEAETITKHNITHEQYVEINTNIGRILMEQNAWAYIQHGIKTLAQCRPAAYTTSRDEVNTLIELSAWVNDIQQSLIKQRNNRVDMYTIPAFVEPRTQHAENITTTLPTVQQRPPGTTTSRTQEPQTANIAAQTTKQPSKRTRLELEREDPVETHLPTAAPSWGKFRCQLTNIHRPHPLIKALVDLRNSYPDEELRRDTQDEESFKTFAGDRELFTMLKKLINRSGVDDTESEEFIEFNSVIAMIKDRLQEAHKDHERGRLMAKAYRAANPTQRNKANKEPANIGNNKPGRKSYADATKTKPKPGPNLRAGNQGKGNSKTNPNTRSSKTESGGKNRWTQGKATKNLNGPGQRGKLLSILLELLK